jgi:hypothetical protein
MPQLMSGFTLVTYSVKERSCSSKVGRIKVDTKLKNVDGC